MRSGARSGLTGAAIFGALGLVYAVKAFIADVNHTLMPAGRPGAGLITPHYGYFIAGLFFTLAVSCLFLAFRARNKSDD